LLQHNGIVWKHWFKPNIAHTFRTPLKAFPADEQFDNFRAIPENVISHS